MNTLFETIKEQRTTALRTEQSVQYAILTTLFAECQMVGKNKRNGNPTDDECLSVIKKFIEGQQEILKYRGDTPEILAEIELYKSYLPVQLTHEQIMSEFTKLGQTSIGPVMKHFNVNFKNMFNGKHVSELFKEWSAVFQAKAS
ncbi:MAG: GatB/YqeY domain-containing protein [Prevotella sp.]